MFSTGDWYILFGISFLKFKAAIFYDLYNFIITSKSGDYKGSEVKRIY